MIDYKMTCVETRTEATFAVYGVPRTKTGRTEVSEILPTTVKLSLESDGTGATWVVSAVASGPVIDGQGVVGTRRSKVKWTRGDGGGLFNAAAEVPGWLEEMIGARPWDGDPKIVEGGF